MQANYKKWSVLAAAMALCAAGGWAVAQDQAPAADAPAADAAADAAPAEGAEAAEGGDAPAEEAAKPVKPVKPRPSELMPLAPKSLMLGIANTGKVLVAVGERGNIIVSKNGNDWAQVQAPARSALTAVAFADENNGWAVGHDAVILHTADGGKTWALQNFEPALEKPFLSVLVLDANSAIAVGAYGLYKKTADGGKTWEAVSGLDIQADELHMNSIVKLNDGSLFIAGEQGLLGRSTDNGATWKKLASPYEASLFGALPAGPKGAVIFGLRGNAYFSSDAAAGGWKKIETGTVSSFFGGSVLPDGQLALVGLNGTLLLTDASGGNVHALKVRFEETDKTGQKRMKEVSSTLSSATPLGKGLVLVGEQGAQSVSAVQ